MRYLRGNSRYQQSFLSIDDQISKANVVRLIDEICETFCASYSMPEKGLGDTGRKAYHPSDLLKIRSEEHTSELQSRENLVCRLLLEKKKKKTSIMRLIA